MNNAKKITKKAIQEKTSYLWRKIAKANNEGWGGLEVTGPRGTLVISVSRVYRRGGRFAWVPGYSAKTPEGNTVLAGFDNKASFDGALYDVLNGLRSYRERCPIAKAEAA